MAPKTSEIDSLQCKTSYEDFSPSYLLFEEILFVRNQGPSSPGHCIALVCSLSAFYPQTRVPAVVLTVGPLRR